MKLLNFMTLVMRKEEPKDAFQTISDSFSTVTDDILSALTSIGSNISTLSFVICGLTVIIVLLGCIIKVVMPRQENVILDHVPMFLTIIGIAAALGVFTSAFGF